MPCEHDAGIGEVIMEERTVDVAIVGAGPIGLELAASLKRAQVDYIQFDAHQIGYTISWWPRNTLFFSTTERIAIAGIPIQSTHQQHISGEQYLAYLRSVVELLDLNVHTYEPVVRVRASGDRFTLWTASPSGERHYYARRVVLAKGDMDAPSRLGIPGEDLPHVTHTFLDPHTYFRKRLLVVGGRNSTLESALRCWRAGSEVTISYRRADFDPQYIKGTILPDIKNQIAKGTIGFLPRTRPVEITPQHVLLERTGGDHSRDAETIAHPTDFVLLCTGFMPDMSLFESVGVTLLGPERIPKCDPDTMETDVPGVYVAGTAAAGIQTRYTLSIENSHEHVARIVAAITGSRPDRIGTIEARRYDALPESIQRD